MHEGRLFWPDLIILGGGASKKFDKFKQQLTVKAPVKPAALLNQAGIVGAELHARSKNEQSLPIPLQRNNECPAQRDLLTETSNPAETMEASLPYLLNARKGRIFRVFKKTMRCPFQSLFAIDIGPATLRPGKY